MLRTASTFVGCTVVSIAISVQAVRAESSFINLQIHYTPSERGKTPVLQCVTLVTFRYKSPLGRKNDSFRVARVRELRAGVRASPEGRPLATEARRASDPGGRTLRKPGELGP